MPAKKRGNSFEEWTFQDQVKKGLDKLELTPIRPPQILPIILEDLAHTYEPNEYGELPIAIYKGKGDAKFLAVQYLFDGDIRYFLISSSTEQAGKTIFLLMEITKMGYRPLWREFKKKVN